MKKSYEVELSAKGIRQLEKALKDYDKWLSKKSEELCRKLATMGAIRASANFSVIKYDGPEDHEISVEERDGGYAVVARGHTVLFVEFGSGITFQNMPHPEAEKTGMGVGTYPGKGHWKDPDGWWYAHGQHTYGNPPNMPMYSTVKELEQELVRVVKEVFEL